jgi:hypothetical protein
MFALASLLTVATPGLRAQDAGYSAGSATVDVTPDPVMINWVNKKPYGGVLDPLQVRALVLAEGGRRVVVLAFDLLEIREAFARDVRDALTAGLGIPDDHVLLNASHSHSAPFPPPGDEPLIAPERDLLLPQTGTAVYKAWAARLPALCLEAVKAADAARRPVTMGIARAWAGDVLFNRRPIGRDGRVKTTLLPADPHALPQGQRFGPVDPTLTWLSFRDQAGKPVAALLHLPAHAVAVYGEHPGLSADWPGATATRLKAELNANVLYLQGCSGDIVPWKRGLENTRIMAERVTERARAAEANWHPLPFAPLRAARVAVELPYGEKARRETGLAAKRTEVQVIATGGVALVALPGEPLTKLGQAIRERSPFPDTIVLGYSNGSGVEYVDIPGEKARGGYEMGEWGLGDDAAGGVLIEAALKLLGELHALPTPPR